MRKPTKIELLNTIPFIIILLLFLFLPDILPKQLYYLSCIIVFIRFGLPVIPTWPNYLYIDFSKIINFLFWLVIVVLIYYIDHYSKLRLLSEKKIALNLFILFSYFHIIRGLFYLINKEEPIFKQKYNDIGDFIKSRNREITKADLDYTNTYFLIYFIIIIITLNN